MGKLKRKERHEAELSQLEKDIDARQLEIQLVEMWWGHGDPWRPMGTHGDPGCKWWHYPYKQPSLSILRLHCLSTFQLGDAKTEG